MSEKQVREMCTAEQRADLLQVSLREVFQLAPDGALPGHKGGSSLEPLQDRRSRLRAATPSPVIGAVVHRGELVGNG